MSNPVEGEKTSASWWSLSLSLSDFQSFPLKVSVNVGRLTLPASRKIAAIGIGVGIAVRTERAATPRRKTAKEEPKGDPILAKWTAAMAAAESFSFSLYKYHRRREPCP